MFFKKYSLYEQRIKMVCKFIIIEETYFHKNPLGANY